MSAVEPDVATQPTSGDSDEHHIVDPDTRYNVSVPPPPGSRQVALCGVMFRATGEPIEDPRHPPADACRTCVEVMWRMEGWS